MTPASSRSDVSFTFVFTISPWRTRCTSSALNPKSAISSSSVGTAIVRVPVPHSMTTVSSRLAATRLRITVFFEVDTSDMVSSVQARHSAAAAVRPACS